MPLNMISSLLIALFGSASIANGAAVTQRATCSGGQVVSNAACCKFVPLIAELQGPELLNNECSDAAHSALRLAFHDAIGFSLSGKGGGGADGSIVVFNATELKFNANQGIDDALDIFADSIHAHPEITPGDYLQFANAVGLTNCPGAPRIQFLSGRPQPKAPSPGPDGLVPEPFDSVQTIISRFADAGFSAEELIALLSSHSTAGADDVDPTVPGTPFDTTHNIFDTQIFAEVQLRGTFFPGKDNGQGEVQSAVRGTMRLQSDHLLARDSATSCIWQSFVNNQQKMQQEFGAAMAKLAITGQNKASLIDCSDIIPAAKPFNGKAQFPPTLTNKDVEQGCATTPFPTLATEPGPATSIAPIPQS